jgi:hypothetical protein
LIVFRINNPIFINKIGIFFGEIKGRQKWRGGFIVKIIYSRRRRNKFLLNEFYHALANELFDLCHEQIIQKRKNEGVSSLHFSSEVTELVVIVVQAILGLAHNDPTIENLKI